MLKHSECERLLSEVETELKETANLILQEMLTECLAAEPCHSENPSGLSSRIGGPSFLPEGEPHPADRAGKPMILVLQLNFSELPAVEDLLPEHGLLMLFCNSKMDFSNPRDRHSFKCFFFQDLQQDKFVPSSFAEPSTAKPVALSFAKGFSLPEGSQSLRSRDSELLKKLSKMLQASRSVQVLGAAGKNPDRLREIAAFAANGISWSEARRKDPCFSHLVEAAKEWLLLAKIDAMPDFGFDFKQGSFYLMIRRDDLHERRFERSCLLTD